MNRHESTIRRFEGPVARMVLAVTQRALLGPLDVERLLICVRGPGGRLELAMTGSPNRPTGMPWGQAAPFISAMRRTRPGTDGSIVRVDDHWVYRYAVAVEGTEEVVVVAAIMADRPPSLAGVHAAVGSAVYSILAESETSIPDASLVVSVASNERGYEVSLARAGVHGNEPVTRSGATVDVAIARCAAALAGNELTIRFADQKAVQGESVSIVVVDSPEVGTVIGASGHVAPGVVSPAVAVFKAANACSRLAAERAAAAATAATPEGGEQFALR
jgi:hypothetical protein